MTQDIIERLRQEHEARLRGIRRRELAMYAAVGVDRSGKGAGMSAPMSDAEVAAQIRECCATHGPDNAARYESLLRTVAEKEGEISRLTTENSRVWQQGYAAKEAAITTADYSWKPRAVEAESALTAATEALRVAREECERLRTVKDAAIVQAEANRHDGEERIAQIYGRGDMKKVIAHLCDTEWDKSGALLGRIREISARASAKEQE